MFVSLNDAISLIQEDKILHIAADETLLNQLPKGKWIAGTTPYFITEQGGITCKDKLFVSEITCAVDYKTVVYEKSNIFDITKDAYPNGMTILIMPFASDVAVFYAKEAPNSDDLLMNPTVGWISGYDLSTNSKAKVYEGTTGICYDDKAVALHICLSDDKMASLGIVNIFNTDENDVKIEFIEDSLSVTKCFANGKEVILSDYIVENKIDTHLPLVADYNSVLVNVSIKSISEKNKMVDFYAPVFAGKEYRFARSVSNYEASFNERLQGFKDVKPIFSCNCILNYLYGELDGKITPPFTGPVTFGEIAYQLLNQTLVYAEIISK
ncbi:DUF6976 family protein [Lutispora thermophila]|uniref:Uncharacterized protein n=1 Tax=Lutispora thermophila DSM 19022 TaxID=1122184 RepID=A0A1M6EVV2_9FIRM|nr:hypothetical protein [Lutispora thermophila]SHI89520.1 hypothetical protein SAMN02745176_01727 [Lutispora thermophila DSM 19022]